MQSIIQQDANEGHDIEMFKEALAGISGEGHGLAGIVKRSHGSPFQLTTVIETRIREVNGKPTVELEKPLKSNRRFRTGIERFVLVQRLANLQNPKNNKHSIRSPKTK